MAFAVFLLIISSAISLAFAFRDTGQDGYTSDAAKNNAAGETGLTDFDAWLEYSIISDGLDADGDDSFTAGTAYICEYNLYRLNQIKKVYNDVNKTILFSAIMILVCYVVVKRRRLYDCIVWGGAAGTGFGALTFIFLLFSKKGVLYGIKEMIFHENYSVFFSTEDDLISLIPDGTALRMFIVYDIVLVVGLIATIIVRYFSKRKSRPHSF